MGDRTHVKFWIPKDHFESSDRDKIEAIIGGNPELTSDKKFYLFEVDDVNYGGGPEMTDLQELKVPYFINSGAGDMYGETLNIFNGVTDYLVDVSKDDELYIPVEVYNNGVNPKKGDFDDFHSFMHAVFDMIEKFGCPEDSLFTQFTKEEMAERARKAKENGTKPLRIDEQPKALWRELTNADRVERARHALESFKAFCGERLANTEDDITDLISDLYHYIASEVTGVSADNFMRRILYRAESHFEVEVEEERKRAKEEEE